MPGPADRAGPPAEASAGPWVVSTLIILALVLSLQRSTLREDFARTVASVTDAAGTIRRFLEIVTGPGRAPDAENLPVEPWMNRVVDELTRHEASTNADGRQP